MKFPELRWKKQVETQEFWSLISQLCFHQWFQVAWSKFHALSPDQCPGKPPLLPQEHQAQPLVSTPPWKLGILRTQGGSDLPLGSAGWTAPQQFLCVFYFITAWPEFSSALQVFDLWSTLMGSSHGLCQGFGEQSVPVLCHSQLEQLPLLGTSLLESPNLWNFPSKCAHPNLHIHSEHILDSQTPTRFISWQLFYNLLTFSSKTFCLL